MLMVYLSASKTLVGLKNVTAGLIPEFFSLAGGGYGPFVCLLFDVISLVLVLVLEFIIHV